MMQQLLCRARDVLGCWLRASAVALWPPQREARLATTALGVSLVSAIGTVWSVVYAGASANAASETLRRSDEDLLILVEFDRHAPVSVWQTSRNLSASFSIDLLADAVVINTGGSPAVVTDSIVETRTVESVYGSRVAVFDASSGARWARFTVVRPGEPQRLRLHATLEGSLEASPAAARALAALFDEQGEKSSALKREFPSINALTNEVRGRAGEERANEFESYLYGPALRGGPLGASPWSEEGEAGFTRIILKVGTANRRVYRSSPGLLAYGPDPAYSIQETPWIGLRAQGGVSR